LASMRTVVLRLHRWIGLIFAAFWLLQAVTGALIVFHWEAEDAILAGAHRDTDFEKINARLTALVPSGSGKRIVSVWVTAGSADRYDVTVADPAGIQHAVRVSGDGTVLRQKLKSERGFMGSLVALHQNLLVGETGEWIVGISGVLLFTTLFMGLIVAWPRGRQWRKSLVFSRNGGPAARQFALHKAVGLWAVLPAILLITAGTMLRFEDGVSHLIGAQGSVAPPSLPHLGEQVPFSRAVLAAKEAIPGSRFTAATFPTQKDNTYRVRLLAPNEPRRAYGTSVVYVSAADGTVRAAIPAARASASKTLMDGLYAVHTGEIAGMPGRLLVFAIGLWLATVSSTGLLLWHRRRPVRGGSVRTRSSVLQQ